MSLFSDRFVLSVVLRLKQRCKTMSYPSEVKTGLTFDNLRLANTKRLKNHVYGKCEDDWTTAHWVQAMLGEFGELANILKKVDRGDFNIESVSVEIGEELADIQTYLDILSHKLGINLGDVTMSKFNKISDRVGSDIYFDCDGEVRADYDRGAI